ncbi:MAG: uroporphyrinogen decarboxylase family protein [Verrucomicrobia bacterium]|nr:uroporphyrinogen decarboxylase family protein [Verrucomicrobiota bacterium]
MNPRERLLAFFNHQPVDAIPALPITMMWAADRIGAPYFEYATKAEVQAAAQVKVARQFGADHVSVISDPATEAADCGAVIFYPPDAPPAIDEAQALLTDPDRLATLERPDPHRPGSRMANRVAAVRLLKKDAGDTHFIEGWIEGPCAEAADLRGINTLMLDFLDDSAFVRSLIDFVIEMELSFAAAQVEAGADIVGIGDAAASLISRQLYDEFIWPAEKRMVDGIHAMGARVRLHICGNTTHLIDAMGRLGADLIDVDYPVDLAFAREKTGPRQILAGNLHPVRTVLPGPPAAITAALQACQNAAGPAWAVGAGCEIPRGTPLENFLALTKFGDRATRGA